MRLSLTHYHEDLDAVWATALGQLRSIAPGTTRPHARDLTIDDLIRAANR
jgi:hypothetical protein